MLYVNDENNVDVKDKRYIIYPIENNVVRERIEPKSLKTQNQNIK